MKSHDEVTNNVFRRRDEYAAVQKRRKKAAIKAGSVIAVLCLTAAAALGVFKSGVLRKTNGAADVQATKAQDVLEVRPEKINMNKAYGGASATMPDYYINNDDFIPFSVQEAIEYYGTDIFPELPADLDEANDSTGIYKDNRVTGKTYHTTFELRYYSSESDREVKVRGDKGRTPVSCVKLIYDMPPEPTIINGDNVFFSDLGGGNFFAKFTHNNVFFEINFYNLSEEEMFNIVSSLTK